MEDYIAVFIFLGIPLVYWIFVYIKEKVIGTIKNEIQTKLERENQVKILEITNYKKELDQYKEDIINLANDNVQNAPYLAERYADYFETWDTKTEKYLLYKKNPAAKASELVSILKKEKKELLKNYKLLQYQLTFLTANFPMLESVLQLETNEVTETLNAINNSSETKDEYDVISKYLSPEEYQKLSNCEKYQLALDRYLNRNKKSKWEIGIMYERYIGYIYETKKYKVVYNGALEGLNDLGRDIIAENDKEILIIQCKYWKKENIIHEKHIFQLYGTVILKQLETSKDVKGIFVTTTSLSPVAKKVAKYLKIKIKENENFDKTYPCIKCNINNSTKEKIYHLPFDQQYDKIQIDLSKGELYVKTTKEAEQLGFRKAKKHMYIAN